MSEDHCFANRAKCAPPRAPLIYLRLSEDDVALLHKLEERRESARAAEKSGQPSMMVPMGRSAYADPLWTF